MQFLRADIHTRTESLRQAGSGAHMHCNRPTCWTDMCAHQHMLDPTHLCVSKQVHRVFRGSKLENGNACTFKAHV